MSKLTEDIDTQIMFAQECLEDANKVFSLTATINAVVHLANAVNLLAARVDELENMKEDKKTVDK